jgi:FixJ family two-component response regulator
VAHDVPRILITAFPKLDLAIQAINVVSVDRFLTKPIQPEQMLDAVRALMAQK